MNHVVTGVTLILLGMSIILAVKLTPEHSYGAYGLEVIPWK